MKVKQSILDKINNPNSRVNIAQKLECGEQAVAVQMRHNYPDGRLTKMDALKAISEEAGCGIDEILEEEAVKA